jgi:GT2 family glycosyltransferase
MSKVLVGVPCGDFVKSKTAFSLLHLIGPSAYTMQTGSDLADNRNRIVAQTLNEENNFSHLLFIDSDMVFTPDLLQRMLKHDFDILGIPCNKRRLPLENNVQPLNPDDKDMPSTLFEAASVGTGVMLIKTRVFKKLPAPWFEFSYDEEGKRVGEDVSFCRKAREQGFRIYCDPTISVQHLGLYAY